MPRLCQPLRIPTTFLEHRNTPSGIPEPMPARGPRTRTPRDDFLDFALLGPSSFGILWILAAFETG